MFAGHALFIGIFWVGGMVERKVGVDIWSLIRFCDYLCVSISIFKELL